MRQLDLMAWSASHRRPRVLSSGGGLDSFAMLLLAVASNEKPDAVVFVDVADPEHLDPGEWPGTYKHLREVVMPFCERHGIEFVWLNTPVRDARSLFAWMLARAQIPVSGPNRICTRIAKVERFESWLDGRYPGREVEVWIGFEAGEESRAAVDPNAGRPRAATATTAARRNRFPLMERGYCRCRCERLVRAAGYPVPRKSACVFCPYGTRGDWQTFARELPEQFAQVEHLEWRKPPTAKNGIKLSIMGFRTLYKRAPDGTRVVAGHRATPLRVFVQGTYRAKQQTCAVCGETRATKATGCGYLSDTEAA